MYCPETLKNGIGFLNNGGIFWKSGHDWLGASSFLPSMAWRKATAKCGLEYWLDDLCINIWMSVMIPDDRETWFSFLLNTAWHHVNDFLAFPPMSGWKASMLNYLGFFGFFPIEKRYGNHDLRFLPLTTLHICAPEGLAEVRTGRWLETVRVAILAFNHYTI